MQFERRTEASARATERASSDPTPAKDSNKDEKSLAESLEGRACTKENVRCAAHRPHTEAGSGDTEADERASGGCVAAFRSPSSKVGAV